ncbi:MAG: SpoIIE family protein phosphatase [Leptospiraceae bacterium]|nr:SpoIIE family protein phosphatase [Leptospiraceae bacterium]
MEQSDVGGSEQGRRPQAVKVKWYKSLTFLILFALTLVPLWDLGGIALIMTTEGRDLVVKESSRLIEQLGNNAIMEIGRRSREIEALTRSLATMGATLPRNEQTFRTMLPPVIDFGQDNAVAGGGVWPEPFKFNPSIEKRSFFYGRDESGSLQYFDDYNHGRGYIHDEWYPVVRYSQPQRCFWSKSYMDPYSFQPMVTCTVAIRKGAAFEGVATIDLKLEGLHALMERIREKTGGYVFLLDRNNRFLTFPEPSLVKEVSVDSDGNRSEEFISAADYAKKQPLFAPIAQAVASMNRDILDQAQQSDRYSADIAAQIDADSDQINREEAEFISAVIADPMKERTKQSYLYRKFTIPDDWQAHEESIVFLFHVPQSYWKLVAVKPMSEAGAVASQINRVLISMIMITILVGVAIAAVLLHLFFTKPIKLTVSGVERVGELIQQKSFDRLSEHRIPIAGENEMGQLAHVINELGSELEGSYKSLVELNEDLEKKVEQRTEDLEKSLSEVSELKFQQDGDYFLTSLLTRPLTVNQVNSETVRVDFLMRQKKRFSFRHWSEEIGGDMCTAHSIKLQGKDYTVVLNGDAMGKSIQGAGGVLVLGSIFEANIKRTRLSGEIQKQSPERWLKNAFSEVQGIFESFNGSMLVSLILAVIDDATGTVYYINADHPRTVILRDGVASFVEDENPQKRVGIEISEGRLGVQVLRLRPGDIMITGSDGRDDLQVGTDEQGNRIINEDETLFLRDVESSKGELEALTNAIGSRGELTDDLSLLRISYMENQPASVEESPSVVLERARKAVEMDKLQDALAILDEAVGAQYDQRMIRKNQIRVLRKMGETARAADESSHYIAEYPWDTDFLNTAMRAFAAAHRLREAVEVGERLRARRPTDNKNLQFLQKIYESLGNAERAAYLSRRIESAT